MPFYEVKDLQETPLVGGVTIKAVYGEKVSVSFLNLASYSTILPHHHDNEQMGIVLEGEMEYTIGDETRTCREGTIFVIPPQITHSVRVISSRPAKIIDIFAPPREAAESMKVIDKKE